MKKIVLVLLTVFLAFATQAETGLKLSALFCDHMVLQRDQPVPIWGWAKPGEEITVEFAPSTGSGQAGQKKTTKADAAGKWMVKLDPMPASLEPQTLSISSTDSKSASSTLKCADILIGDVWLCGGQSNMGVGINGSLNAEQEIAQAQYPAIRFFSVTPNPVIEPVDDVKGQWNVCSPQTIAGFSGVGYSFGRALHRNLKIPIGLLRSSMGASAAEAWTSLEVLRTMPDLAETAAKQINQAKSQESDNRKFLVDRAAWEEKYGVKPPPISEMARGWADPNLDTSDWKPVTQPASWARLGVKSGGVFWIRKELTLPAEAAGKRLDLSPNGMGEQYDTAFFNGTEIGRGKDEAPEFYNAQRRYTVPGKLVRAGRNILAIRVVSATQNAYVWQLGRPLELPSALKGSTDARWLMKTESTFAPLSAEALKARPKPNSIVFRDVSTALFNGGIAPLIPFAIKGAIWYQGESNAFQGDKYARTLTALIGDWRSRFGQGDFPFYIVQLANYYDPVTTPVSTEKKSVDDWVARVREGQMKVAQTVPRSGLAVAIDIGEKSIHPLNKQDVGDRLARLALARTYGMKEVEHESPLYASMSREGAAIRVRLTHCPRGLMVASKTGLDPVRETPGAKLAQFAIAGADRKFVWAEARIDGPDSVVVSSPEVSEPVAVRYAWAINPEGCNLYGKNGLPASPFRTDEWPVPEK